MASFYMCLVFNNKQYTYISPPRFFQNIYEARIYAITHAKIHKILDELYINIGCIYKIAFNEDFDIGNEIFNGYFEMYRSRECSSVILIQKHFSIYFKRKMDAIILLQYRLKRAIANPRTKLCQKRLLREFYGM